MGMDKVNQISQHVNMILRYVPYVQTNLILGLDVDYGQEPFTLTKRFLDLSPGAFPAYSLLSAFGQAAPLNLELQRANRVLPFPFHFLNNNQAMNVRPQNYSWPEFYDHLIDVTKYSFSKKMIFRRFNATRGAIPRWLNVVRFHQKVSVGYDTLLKCVGGWTQTVSSGVSLSRKPRKFLSFMCNGYAMSWARSGNGCRRARCTTIPMPI